MAVKGSLCCWGRLDRETVSIHDSFIPLLLAVLFEYLYTAFT